MSLLLKLLLALGGAYLLDVTLRERIAAARARRLAHSLGRPLLNVGSGYGGSSATGAKLRGDANCDIAAPPGAPCGPKTVCRCDVQDLPFADKQFGVALAANVLRYVPDRGAAERELRRVAEHVVVTDTLLPWPQLGPGPRLPVNGLAARRGLDYSGQQEVRAMHVISRTLGDLQEVSRVVVGGVREDGRSSLGDLVMVLEGVQGEAKLGRHTRTLDGDPRRNVVQRIEVEK